MCVCGVMVSVVGNGHCDLSSKPDEAVYISHGSSTLGKDVNPTILPPSMSTL